MPRLTILGMLATLLGLSGCVLPVDIKQPGSPTLVGMLRRSDGMPAIGARAAIPDYYSHASCAQIRARTFTDSSGVFRFAPTTYVQHWVMLFPAFERFSNGYAVCAGPSDSTLDRGYEGSVSLGYKAQPARDTLRCLEWEWQGRSRVTCTGPDAEDAIQTRGTWRDARGTGFYRLIVVRDRVSDERLGVYLQWVQRNDSGPPERVRETIALPLAARVLTLDEAALYSTSAGVCVSARSTGRPPHWYSLHQAELHEALLLGAPGETRANTSCP